MLRVRLLFPTFYEESFESAIILYQCNLNREAIKVLETTETNVPHGNCQEQFLVVA